MIAKLAGIAEQIEVDSAVIDVGGVGYLVFCSSRTLATLAAGQPASLFVDTHVREDRIALYGFASEAERAWFRLMQTVQGVGAKVALNILSVLAPDQLARAIAAGDRAAVQRADGVGLKLAQRLVAELKDKAGTLALGAAARATAQTVAPVASVDDDAVSALVNLGIGRTEAYAAVAKAHHSLGEGAALNAVIRAALKDLGR
ncbi:MAG: Holliday junction branch migration protein RuvA [Alphaproteobacteria bacterium]|nr:Holliday junction branch migration protein RuvA [Alphaproteobacteria bacterium]TAD91433.1 MAG: Holliday junction branch migration protein RuvA [Alphaproteobacteria bacterium]